MRLGAQIRDQVLYLERTLRNGQQLLYHDSRIYYRLEGKRQPRIFSPLKIPKDINALRTGRYSIYWMAIGYHLHQQNTMSLDKTCFHLITVTVRSPCLSVNHVLGFLRGAIPKQEVDPMSRLGSHPNQVVDLMSQEESQRSGSRHQDWLYETSCNLSESK